MQTLVVVNQTITGSGSNFVTPVVDVPSGFTSASYTWSISTPQNNATFGRALVQGSNDGVTWFDMFGLGSNNGSTGNGSGGIGTLPAHVKAILNWSGGFVLSVSISLFP